MKKYAENWTLCIRNFQKYAVYAYSFEELGFFLLYSKEDLSRMHLEKSQELKVLN